jgi:hypothetical protein
MSRVIELAKEEMHVANFAVIGASHAGNTLDRM